MREDYSDLGEVFDRLETLSETDGEYMVLKGLVYDTLRYEVEREIPSQELAEVSRLLHSKEVEPARQKVSEYLEPGEKEVLQP